LSNGTAVFELESNEVFSDNFENERPLKFSPFANLLMTTNDQSTSVYDTETWSIHVTNAVPMAITCAYSNDARWMATGHKESGLTLWDLGTGKTQKGPDLPFVPNYNNAGLDFSSDNEIIATLGQDSKINLWNLPCQKSPANPKVFPLPFPITPDQSGVNIRYRVEFSADGKTLVVCHGGISGVLKGSVGVFNIDSQSWTEFHMPNLLGLALSANGKMLATGHKPEGLKLWNIDTDPAEILIEEGSRRKWIFDVCLSKDGRTLIGGCSGGILLFYNLVAERSVFKMSVHELMVIDTRFSPDGRILVTTDSAGTIKLWRY
jgi:WD40 repeat protein